MSFPQMTVRDMINVQKALLDALGVKALHAVVGGSLGGMQVLEWGIMYPGFVRSLIPIATASQHSPWCIGLNELARQAIMNDSEWKNGNYDPHQQPVHGLSLARQIAMISYRSDISFQSRFGRTRVHEESPGFGSSSLFNVESYLRYQGKKLVDRFDANTYIYISRAMDVHDVAVGRGDVPAALSRIVVPTMVIGISSDILYPVHEQKTIASTIADAEYEQIDSPHGHDAFLIEYEQLSTIVSEFFHRML
jgi:homoserine O-acetyltransferase